MAASEDAVEAAAAWLAATKREAINGPIIPTLQNRFGLSAVEACAAIKGANQIRTAAHQIGEAAS